MKRLNCAAIGLALVLTGLPVLAAPPDGAGDSQATKQPWEWTDAERLAGRFDPSFLKAIRHPRRDLPAGVVARDEKDSDWSGPIYGEINPELVLPFEAFNELLQGVYDFDPSIRDRKRLTLDPRLAAFGYADPSAFWGELEPIVHDHIARARSAYDLSGKLQRTVGSEHDAIQKQILVLNTCWSRTEALAAARAHYGRENFDRLLYTVAAPGVNPSARSGADTEFQLAWIETGCQAEAASLLVSAASTAAPARASAFWNRGAVRSKKSPWQWTDAERMAFRLDPNLIEVHEPAAASDAKWQMIHGATHPEAIFPFELFDTFLTMESGRVPDHERFNARLFAFGVTDTDAWWQDLHGVIDPYTAPNRERAGVATRLQRAGPQGNAGLQKQLADLQRTQCRSTVQGLTAAREHFGRETFDRFLYMVVAPELVLNKWVGKDLAKDLAFQADGCRLSTDSTAR